MRPRGPSFCPLRNPREVCLFLQQSGSLLENTISVSSIQPFTLCHVVHNLEDKVALEMAGFVRLFVNGFEVVGWVFPELLTFSNRTHLPATLSLQRDSDVALCSSDMAPLISGFKAPI
ncbi:hypothetical protein VNO78_19859 [Psophocarpus tetragonolobus]|uniref:Uncharacterized protein n=1 Tax=Psophocarpus tetragonolobus TaxID=3891 RepID=A0AAN9SCA8_PSOTE